MDNETKHTAEPWHLSLRQAEQIIYNADGWAVANATVYHGHDDPDGEAKANARRIVACVNAFEGIDDPEKWMGELADALRDTLAIMDACAAIKPWGDAGHKASKKARATLAKVQS